MLDTRNVCSLLEIVLVLVLFCFLLSSESDVFEIVLPITVLVLGDDDFLVYGSEEQAASIPKSEEEDELEVNLNSSILLQSNGTPSNYSNSVRIWEENKTASNEGNSITYTEEKQVAESVCNESELYLTDGYIAGMDECQNYMLPTSSCKTQLTERNEASCREECDGDDSSQKIHPLLSAGIEGRYDTIKTNSQVTLAATPKHEEEPVSVADGSSQEKQREIPKEIGTIVEMKSKLFVSLVQELKKPQVFERGRRVFKKNARPIYFRVSISTWINIKCSRKRILAGECLVFSQTPVKSNETKISWYCCILLQFARRLFIRKKYLKINLKSKRGIIFVRMEP